MEICERSEHLILQDKTTLFVRYFTPSSSKEHMHGQTKETDILKGMVLFVHGFGEHSGRYRDLAKQVCLHQLAFVTFDLRGHGESGPSFGDVQNSQSLILDVITVLQHAKKVLEFRSILSPFLGLIGHSFGGLLCTYVAAILKLDCPPMLLSNPLYKVAQKVPLWKKPAAEALAKISPRLKLPIGIDPNNLSTNLVNNKAYLRDKLTLKMVTARMGAVFFELLDMDSVSSNFREISTPITVLLGDLDKLVDSSQAKAHFSNKTQFPCKVVTLENTGHEIFFEKEDSRQVAYSQLDLWLRNSGSTL